MLEDDIGGEVPDSCARVQVVQQSPSEQDGVASGGLSDLEGSEAKLVEMFPYAAEDEVDIECPTSDVCIVERLLASSIALGDVPDARLGDRAEIRRQVTDIIARFPMLFSDVDANAGPSDYQFPIVFREEVKGLHSALRTLTENVAKESDDQVDKLLTKGFIKPSTSNFVSPIHMVHQKDKYRMCIDYSKLNDLLEPMDAPIPSIKDLLHCLRGKKIFATLDLSSGYHQFPVVEEHRKYTAFVTHSGVVVGQIL